MKSLLLVSLSFFSFFQFGLAQVVFYEDFQGGPFPSGWARYNVDNLNPDVTVAFVNNAWVTTNDYFLNTSASDSCAYSTSYYFPGGIANDWMVTPAITVPANGILSWRAACPDNNYRDGYEIRIANAQSLAAQQAGTVLYTNAQENYGWTYRQVSLSAYAGQTVYISFRNNTPDQFLLMLDDIKVESQFADINTSMINPPSPYSIVPGSHLQPLNFTGKIRNSGTLAVTNARFSVSVEFGGNVVYTATSNAAASIAAGDSSSLLGTAPYTPNQGEGVYTITYTTSMTQLDAVANNNTQVYKFEVSDFVYGRDYHVFNEPISAVFSLGNGTNPGEVGHHFTAYNNDVLTHLEGYITNALPGSIFRFRLYSVNANGVPNAVLAETSTNMVTAGQQNSIVRLPLTTGYQLVAGQRYFISLTGNTVIAVGATARQFARGTTYAKFGTSMNWTLSEAMLTPINAVPIIRAVLRDCSTIGVQGTFTNELTGIGGTITLNNVTGTAPFTYAWSNGATTQNLTNLPAGTYAVTVSDKWGCQATQNFVIQNLVSVPNLERKIFTFGPNPTDGAVQFEFFTLAEQSIEIQLFNQLGQQLEPTFMLPIDAEGKLNLDMAKYPAGQYFVQFQSGSQRFVARVIKR